MQFRHSVGDTTVIETHILGNFFAAKKGKNSN